MEQYCKVREILQSHRGSLPNRFSALIPAYDKLLFGLAQNVGKSPT